jgi:hypothetical protein
MGIESENGIMINMIFFILISTIEVSPRNKIQWIYNGNIISTHRMDEIKRYSQRYS